LGWRTNKKNGHNNFGLETLCWKTKKKNEELEKFCVGKQRIKVKDFLRVSFPLVREIKRTRYWLVCVEIALMIIGVGLFSHALTEPHSHSWLHCVSYLMEEK
jgi:hypothetical protein